MEMVKGEESIQWIDNKDKDYINDCANPIIIHLCKSSVENLHLAVARCRVAFMVLCEHKAMNLLSSIDDESSNDDENMSLSSKQDICQRRRQRVTDMINSSGRRRSPVYIYYDNNVNKVLKHLREEDDDIPPPKKKPRHNMYMNNSYFAGGSKQGSQITVEDTKNKHKNPPQIYLTPGGIYQII